MATTHTDDAFLQALRSLKPKPKRPEKRRIEKSYSSRDKKEMRSIIETFQEREGQDYYTEETLVAEVRANPPRLGRIYDQTVKTGEKIELAGAFLVNVYKFVEIGLGFRFYTSSSDLLARAQFLASRYAYLGSQDLQGSEWSIYQVYDIYETFVALACNDQKVLQAHVKRYPGPYNDGYAWTRLLRNSVFALLKRDQKEAESFLDEIDKQLALKRRTRFESAYLRAAMALVMKDAAAFNSHLLDVLTYHRGSEVFSTLLLDHWSYPAHGWYNLAKICGLEGINEPEHKRWDPQFQKAIEKPNATDQFESWLSRQLKKFPAYLKVLLNPPIQYDLKDLIEPQLR